MGARRRHVTLRIKIKDFYYLQQKQQPKLSLGLCQFLVFAEIPWRWHRTHGPYYKRKCWSKQQQACSLYVVRCYLVSQGCSPQKQLQVSISEGRNQDQELLVYAARMCRDTQCHGGVPLSTLARSNDWQETTAPDSLVKYVCQRWEIIHSHKHSGAYHLYEISMDPGFWNGLLQFWSEDNFFPLEKPLWLTTGPQ